jgi:hypothetical protein
MSKLAVPASFIFSRDALYTYARSTVAPAEARPRVRQILLATLSAPPHEASHVEHQPPRACILRPSARLSRGCALAPRRRTASSTIFAPPAPMRGNLLRASATKCSLPHSLSDRLGGVPKRVVYDTPVSHFPRCANAPSRYCSELILSDNRRYS